MECTIRVGSASNGQHRVTGKTQGEDFTLPSFRRPENALKVALAIQEAYREDSREWEHGESEQKLEISGISS